MVAALPPHSAFHHAPQDLDAGKLPQWNNMPAPELAMKYWRLAPGATMRDVLLVVRADEVRCALCGGMRCALRRHLRGCGHGARGDPQGGAAPLAGGQCRHAACGAGRARLPARPASSGEGALCIGEWQSCSGRSARRCAVSRRPATCTSTTLLRTWTRMTTTPSRQAASTCRTRGSDVRGRVSCGARNLQAPASCGMAASALQQFLHYLP